MNSPLNFDIGTATIAPRGSRENHNSKLCWQSHDDYYECISGQLEKEDSNGTGNQLLH